MKKIYYLIGLIGLALIAGIAIYYSLPKRSERSQFQERIEPTPSPAPSKTPSLPQEANGLVFPLTRYKERLTKNLFGSFYTTDRPQLFDRDLCPGASVFTGYHTADDLEVFPEEQNSPVDVFSIAQGKILRAQNVNGYGGLIVAEHFIKGQTYTAYYGHININSTKLKPKDDIEKGQKLAELAEGCTAQNDNVRKHLHFGLHKGDEIDLRGYVEDKESLQEWVDPLTVLGN